MSKLVLTETGVSSKTPTKMGINCVLSVKDRTMSGAIEAIHKEVYAYDLYLKKVFGEEKFDLNKGTISTTKCYKTVEKSKGTINRQVESERVFSHYSSSCSILCTADINLDILVSVIEYLAGLDYVSYYNFNFFLTEEETNQLNDEAIRDAYKKATQKASLFVDLEKAKGYEFKSILLDVRNSNPRYGSAEKTSMRLDSESIFSDETKCIMKDTIDIKDITVSKTLEFVIKLIKE